MPLVPDQGTVQQLAPAAADPPFRDRIHSRRPGGGADDPHACCPEHRIERRREAGVPVVQHELDPRPGIFQVHEQVPGLLHDPGLDGVLGGAEDPDAAGAVLDDGQHIDPGAVEQVGGEEVQRQDPLRLRPQEPGPARAVPAGRRIDPRALEDPPGHPGPRPPAAPVREKGRPGDTRRRAHTPPAPAITRRSIALPGQICPATWPA